MLAELTALPFAQRLPRLRSIGQPELLLLALGDEDERLATVEVTRAIAAAETVVELADAVGGSAFGAAATDPSDLKGDFSIDHPLSAIIAPGVEVVSTFPGNA